MTSWKEIPERKRTQAFERFLNELGDQAEAVVARMNNSSSSFLRELARFAKNNEGFTFHNDKGE
jgi:hypothetical protein